MLKNVSFSSHESNLSRHDRFTIERTLPKELLLLGLVSRVLITLDLSTMVCLVFEK